VDEDKVNEEKWRKKRGRTVDGDDDGEDERFDNGDEVKEAVEEAEEDEEAEEEPVSVGLKMGIFDEEEKVRGAGRERGERRARRQDDRRKREEEEMTVLVKRRTSTRLTSTSTPLDRNLHSLVGGLWHPPSSCGGCWRTSNEKYCRCCASCEAARGGGGGGNSRGKRGKAIFDEKYRVDDAEYL
jgi:hypothetical protein